MPSNSSSGLRSRRGPGSRGGGGRGQGFSGNGRGRGRSRGGGPGSGGSPISGRTLTRTGICHFYWSTGACDRGFDCTYKHEASAQVSSSATLSTDYTPMVEVVKDLRFADSRERFSNCENGHTSVTTECGGAMHVTRCPECRAPVGLGGPSHRSYYSNTRALEFENIARQRAPVEKLPTPEPEPAPAVESPAPAASHGPPPAPSPASPSQPPAPVASSQPAPAPAPAVPKTWAYLAATNPKWGSDVAQESRGTSEVPAATSSSPGSGTQTLVSHYAPNARPRQQSQELHPNHVAATNVSNALCFIKRLQENVTEAALRNTLASRFGPIKNLDLVRRKACAFLEFSNVDAARRAIIASLPASQGGEGGIRVDVGDDQQVRITVETRRARGERPVSRPRGGAPVNGDVRGGFRGRGGGRA